MGIQEFEKLRYPMRCAKTINMNVEAETITSLTGSGYMVKPGTGLLPLSQVSWLLTAAIGTHTRRHAEPDQRRSFHSPEQGAKSRPPARTFGSRHPQQLQLIWSRQSPSFSRNVLATSVTDSSNIMTLRTCTHSLVLDSTKIPRL
jgi:hypothetical protein